MSRTENVTFTNMCMVLDNDAVLVQDRRDPEWPGISFPGGHVETGESFTDAVIREVQEETGLTISRPRLVGVKDWYDHDHRYVVMFYRADHFFGNLRSSEEGEVWWEPLNNLSHLKMANDMEKMVKVFLEDELSEFFYRRDGENWVQELK